VRYLPPAEARAPGLIRKGVVALAGIAVVGLGLIFSMLLAVFMLFAAMLAFGYFRWKTRGLQNQMLFHQFRGMAMERDEGEPAKGEVIEGEAVRVDVGKDEK
jgi:flagellar biosynthesis component FlhA